MPIPLQRVAQPREGIWWKLAESFTAGFDSGAAPLVHDAQRGVVL
jgi:hypothetical protein